jgi:adenosylcobinamide kinase/adenosylcobinamide-phosphate guanylyltransferase
LDDKEWQDKIILHRKRRPKDWKLIEATDLLNTLRKEEGPLLIDSIGRFVIKSIRKEQNEWSTKMNLLISLLMKRTSTRSGNITSILRDSRFKKSDLHF